MVALTATTMVADVADATIADGADPIPNAAGIIEPRRKTEMPMPSIPRAATIAAATMLAGAVLFVQTSGAISADSQMAQSSPPASTAPVAKTPRTKRSPAEFVERRIQTLHDELKITKAEEPQWDAVATAMRDNAKSVGALIATRAKEAKSMSAIDNLRTYQAISKAHLDGINKLIAAFEPLYAAMPEAQKKIADMVFARRPTRPTSKSK